MKHYLNLLYEHHHFSREEAGAIMDRMLNEEIDAIQIGAFLSAMNVKGVTATELAGFMDSLRKHALKPSTTPGNALDVCGTGGDGKNTFNISTLAGLVVATAGHPVVKHGNAAVSSNCGSSDILSRMGLRFTNNYQTLAFQLENSSFCYLHAPLFHPALKAVGSVRKSLQVKTFFNQLGPLVNPFLPKVQVSGVFNMDTLRLYAAILPETVEKFAVVHSMDGYDEISLTGPFKMVTQEGEFLYKPQDFGLPTADPSELYTGNTTEETVDQFTAILKGKGTQTQNNVVAINAGVALHLAENISIKEGYEKAISILLSGKCHETLMKSIDLSMREN